VTVRYLRSQIEAGAQAVQLFDSWAGIHDLPTYRRFGARYAARVLDALADTGVPRIYIALAATHLAPAIAELPLEAVSVDWRLPLSAWRDLLPGRTLQGNLDPAALLGTWDTLRAEATDVLREGLGGPHVFNLGHGIFREADPDQVARLVDLVQGFDRVAAAAEAAAAGERRGAHRRRARVSGPGWAEQATERRARVVERMRRGQARAGARVRGDRRRRNVRRPHLGAPRGRRRHGARDRGRRRLRARRRQRLRRARRAGATQPGGRPPRHRGPAVLRDRDLDGAAPPNPYAPAFHANFRYFECGDGERPRVWWFGGGLDLTPAYPTDADVRHFHRALAAWCDALRAGRLPDLEGDLRRLLHGQAPR
jgi:hypothetical protein